MRTSAGMSALMTAAEKGFVECTKELVDCEYNVLDNKKKTALERIVEALQARNPPQDKYLLKRMRACGLVLYIKARETKQFSSWKLSRMEGLFQIDGSDLVAKPEKKAHASPDVADSVKSTPRKKLPPQRPSAADHPKAAKKS